MVTKQRVNDAQGVISTDWVGYKHSKSGGETFKLLKITHSDQDMTGTSGNPQLTADMSKTFTNVNAVYVYNKTDTPDKPRVICIVQGSNNWYAAGGSATAWTVPATPPTSNPDNVQESELDTAIGGSQGFTPQGTTYTIKLDKRPLNATSSIKYRTKDKEITVTKTPGATSGPVPDGYVRYAHTFSTINDPKFKHNGFPLDLKPAVTGNVTAVYVYYHKDNDADHQFPLIVCVKTSTASATTYAYHKRGNQWNEIRDLSEVDPDDHEPQKEVPNN